MTCETVLRIRFAETDSVKEKEEFGHFSSMSDKVEIVGEPRVRGPWGRRTRRRRKETVKIGATLVIEFGSAREVRCTLYFEVCLREKVSF